MHVIEKIEYPGGIVLKIVPDNDVEPPHRSSDMVGQITYNERSRYVLGSEAVSAERFEEIGRGIADGSLVGMPVWAYVHSDATIRAADSNPFTCPWDSGRSGWVYTTKERAIEECGSVEKALECLKAEVETFDQYLQGDVYGYVIEGPDGNQLDSCWGFYGLDYAREMAQDAARNYVAAVPT